MDAHFLAQSAKAETTANIKAVINLLSQLQPDGDAAFAQQITTLQNNLRPQRNPAEQYAEAFTFVVPEQTFDQTVARLRGTPLTPYLHYREINGIMYANTNNEPFNMPDPTIIGQQRRADLLANAEQPPTPEALQQAYDNAYRQQAHLNTVAAAQQPNWVKIQ